MKNVIFTASDSKYGNFLINHWLVSLKDNVDLSNIDVVVLDYGLTKEQISKLKGVIVYKGVRDGHVNVIRFRDMLKFLEKRKYDQVLSIDSGDIIFQDDINPVFEENKKYFRAIVEDINVGPFVNIFLKGFFKKKDGKKIKDALKGKNEINGGVVFGPYNKFKNLCKACNEMITDKSTFGPDQVVINYVLYRGGFKSLDIKYNFVIVTTKHKFFIKDCVFYLGNKEKIAIVHNAGNKKVFRPIKNFGYGKNYNQTKMITLFIQRIIAKAINFSFRRKV